ncbi:hypothetical protein L209DRAFT_750148 [Thermothelomyces heterothallicus CBS 203.75]
MQASRLRFGWRILHAETLKSLASRLCKYPCPSEDVPEHHPPFIKVLLTLMVYAGVGFWPLATLSYCTTSVPDQPRYGSPPLMQKERVL